MLEAALFRHDRIPGNMLYLANHGLSVEVGKLHAFGGNHGQVAIGQKEQIASVIENRRNIGGDKIFVLAQADDCGRPLRAATILFGSSTEITASANTPVSFHRLANSLFQRRPVAVASLRNTSPPDGR